MLALAPLLYNKIKFNPQLPSNKISLGQYQQLSTDLKTICFFNTNFWKKKGMSGQIISPQGPVTFSMDDSKGDVNALMGFVNGRIQSDFLKLSKLERKEKILKQYSKLFEIDIKELKEMCIEYIDYSWISEDYSYGCVGIMPSGALTQWNEFASVVNNIHFAGTETATYWVGMILTIYI